jgi:hypothetical protein
VSVTEDLFCQRCGREQPVLHSPCPECSSTIGSASSIPHLLQTPQEAASTATDPPMRGGDAEPSSAILIKDPELRAAFLRAYRACENAR